MWPVAVNYNLAVVLCRNCSFWETANTRMIVITGAAGFIGSVVAGHLNAHRYTDLVLVDDFSRAEREANYRNKQYTALVEREVFFDWVADKTDRLQAIVHLGARTDTAEQDWEVFQRLNLDYSQQIWQLATRLQIPLVYASSAATYGDGSRGFSDHHSGIPNLSPLNPYGRSKQLFDEWVLQQTRQPFFWAGLKFFNVYGPNEYHKGRMASVVYHCFNQIEATGKMKLFRSHRPDYRDGEQQRDFVYVKDVARVIRFLLEERPASGIFNLGSGEARTFLSLAKAVFAAKGLQPNIQFIDTPLDIRESYQYFTEAEMDKLRKAGYQKPFTSLEAGIQDYVQNFLEKQARF